MTPWYNKKLLIDRKSFFWDKWVRAGTHLLEDVMGDGANCGDIKNTLNLGISDLWIPPFKFISVDINICTCSVFTSVFTSVCSWRISNIVWKNWKGTFGAKKSQWIKTVLMSFTTAWLHQCDALVVIWSSFKDQQVDHNWELRKFQSPRDWL